MATPRRAFTLMEVAVAAVLIAVLAAATIPTLAEFASNRDAAATASTLSQIASGIATFKNSVLSTGASTSNTYPRLISSLTNPITSSTPNSCGSEFSNHAVTHWADEAPYVTFNIPPGGLHTPLGLVQDTTVRLPNSPDVGVLAIRTTVDSVDALRLDRIIDGGDGASVGTLRITAFNGSGGQTRTADIQYLLPVAAKC